MSLTDIYIFGYSGHALVAYEIFAASGQTVKGYFTKDPVIENPYDLKYMGFEGNENDLEKINGSNYFVAIGDNFIRAKVSQIIETFLGYPPVNAIHPQASISKSSKIGNGIMIGNGVIINAFASIGDGVICNTGAIIEHESIIGDYTHVAPGAVLCGSVHIGEKTLVGARSVIIPEVKIGKEVIIGAGTTVTKNIPSQTKVVGNPQRFI